MATIGADIQRAITLLNQGELVAIPTETVYGLAGNALQQEAVLKIFKTKNRPAFDPLIIHTNSLEKVKNFTKAIPEKAIHLAKRFWPGPLTLLLPKADHIPDLVTSGLPTVAVRIPQHPMSMELLEQIDYPLAAPSANPFGYISPTKASHVQDQLGDKIPYILDGGDCTIGVESTIIGFEEDQPVVYRLGGTSIEFIEAVIGKVKILPHSSSEPKAPGMLKSHYAPSKKVIVGNIDELIKEFSPLETGILAFNQYYTHIPKENQFILTLSGDMDEAARNLFSSLRKLDDCNIKVILAEPVPDHGLGKAINDRLKRASA
jgi:L-threonylcarbamoyladenylate synthase